MGDKNELTENEKKMKENLQTGMCQAMMVSPGSDSEDLLRFTKDIIIKNTNVRLKKESTN